LRILVTFNYLDQIIHNYCNKLMILYVKLIINFNFLLIKDA